MVAPFLQGLAARSKVFDNHWSNSIIPSKADSSLFPAEMVAGLAENGTGLFWLCEHTPEPGVDGFSFIQIPDREQNQWATQLDECLGTKGRGQILAVVDLPHALPPWKLGPREADLYFPEQGVAGPGGDPEPEQGDPDDFIHARPWPGQLPDHVAPDDDLTHLRIIETQAAAVGGLDAFVRALFQVIDDNIPVLVVGDRGIEVGDREFLGHGNPWPWLTRVHVPCVWNDPLGDAKPQRIVRLSHHGDIAVTIGNRLMRGNVKCNGSESVDLADLALADSVEADERILISDGLEGCRAIRSRDWTLMTGNGIEPRLYRLPEDKWEVLDLSSQHPEKVEKMRAQLLGKNA